jgi:hypothetical protein
MLLWWWESYRGSRNRSNARDVLTKGHSGRSLLWPTETFSPLALPPEVSKHYGIWRSGFRGNFQRQCWLRSTCRVTPGRRLTKFSAGQGRCRQRSRATANPLAKAAFTSRPRTGIC